MISACLALLISALYAINCATVSYSVRQVTSPYTSKTYLLHNSHSTSTHHSAELICHSYPGARLASLTADSGDIGFLGGLIESLDEPFWIGDMGGTSANTNCAALFAGGAIAIPKPSSPHKSPCDALLSVLCELD